MSVTNLTQQPAPSTPSAAPSLARLRQMVATITTRTDLDLGNDDGFAQAFVQRYQNRVKFISEEGQWLVFNEATGWHRDPTGREVLQLFVELSRELRTQSYTREAITPAQTGEERRLRETSKLGNKNRLDPALELAKVDPRLQVSAADLDREPHLLGTRNGVVNLRDGSFQPHSQSVLVTRSVDCDFIPDAQCPRFLAFLEEVQPDPEMRGYLQRLFGYSLSGDIGEHILPFHYGTGANGKGTTLEQTFLTLMGSYGAKLTDSLVYLDRRGSSPALEIAGLCGIRFALGEENESGGSLNERQLKSMTGGDRQKGRFLYRDFVEYMPTAKVHLVGNHRPRIIGRDHGFWRRFRMINWGVMIPNERQNLHLAAELAEEFPGILNWLIEGYRALGCRGTQPPDSVMVASEQFREASDRFGDFLREMTVDAPEATISKAELYTQYTRYCDQQGIQPRYRLTKRAFGNRIAERGYREIRTHGGVHVWQGLRARTELDTLDPEAMRRLGFN